MILLAALLCNYRRGKCLIDIGTEGITLVLAIVFNYTIHRKVVLSENVAPPLTVVVAVVSLLLWISVVFGGLFIAFVM